MKKKIYEGIKRNDVKNLKNLGTVRQNVKTYEQELKNLTQKGLLLDLIKYLHSVKFIPVLDR